jgi:hypothetical protein
MIRMAYQSGFVGLTPEGHWIIKEIPKNFDKFDFKIKSETSEYRKTLPSRYAGQNPSSKRIMAKPSSALEKFEISESNLTSVIVSILRKKKELEEENKQLKEKLVSISKKVKKFLRNK